MPSAISRLIHQRERSRTEKSEFFAILNFKRVSSKG